jgi:hypothetical protein
MPATPPWRICRGENGCMWARGGGLPMRSGPRCRGGWSWCRLNVIAGQLTAEKPLTWVAASRPDRNDAGGAGVQQNPCRSLTWLGLIEWQVINLVSIPSRPQAFGQTSPSNPAQLAMSRWPATWSSEPFWARYSGTGSLLGEFGWQQADLPGTGRTRPGLAELSARLCAYSCTNRHAHS